MYLFKQVVYKNYNTDTQIHIYNTLFRYVHDAWQLYKYTLLLYKYYTIIELHKGNTQLHAKM